MRPDTTSRPGAVVLGLACAACLLGALGGCGKTAREYFKASQSARTAQEEEELLTRSLGKDPDFKDARVRRAWVYAMRGRPDDALSDYDALHRTTVEYYERKMAAYDNLPPATKRKQPKGREILQTRRQRDIAFILHRRARALELNGRFAEAVQNYTTTLQHNPVLLDIYVERAGAYFKMGRYAESMHDYNTMLERNIHVTGDAALARRGEWRLRRGFAGVCAGEWAIAAADFQAALQGLRSKHRKAQAFLGLYVVACRIGSKKDADRELLVYARETRTRYKGSMRANTWIFRAVWHVAGLIDERQFLLESRHPNKRLADQRLARAYYYIGTRLLVSGDKKRAKEAFTICGTVNDPALIEYHLAKVELERLATGGKTSGEYAALAKKEKDRSKQIGLLTEALGVNLNDADARRKRGILYSLAGDYDRAIDDFTRLLDVYKKPADKAKALRYRAFAYAQRGHHLTALRDYGAAIKADPKLWQAREGMTRSFCALRRYDEAVAVYTTLTKQVTRTDLGPFWQHERAFALACAGKWKEAAADLRALVKSKETPVVHANLYIAERRLGNKDADKALKAYVDKTKPTDWQTSAARHLAGLLDEKTFLRLSEHSDGAVQALRTSRAYYYIGALNLIRARKAEAGKAFNKCVQVGRAAGRESWEFRMALAELGRTADWR